ncbi:redoxin domain-containing protein [Planomicrobium sp. CPCC 101110]|uniref:redoxin domain-containing protein n=1 Tax=Planomicrobium sp. CPCC 101110 TaxID=2599619 RepID=UPI0011B3F207|nr:redoxin domain-containing protein [Planomicrobium sp. CPCC 101110]TWT27953.1 redoxin domain-containing protein [Planomicrobium sp. CPCC 101110]
MPKKLIGLLLIAVMIGIAVAGAVKNNIEENKSLETLSVGTDVEFLATKDGLAPGEVAPDFELTTLSGETAKLSDYKGKKVILNFWATWCPPCKAEMPLMQNYYDEAQGENVEVLAVNLTTQDRGVDKVKEFVEANNLTFPIPLDKEGDIGSVYQAVTIPTSYMIDTEGRVQNKHIGPMDEETMRDYIANLE